MSAPQLKDLPATHVVFRLHGITDQEESQKAKRLIVKDIEVCDISFAGNKTTVGTFPAVEIADWYDDPETGYRRERTYAEKYAAEYKAFKDGNPGSVAGTPLEALDISENKRKELRGVNIWTVEALASVDGSNLKNLGMGGRELKDKAQTFLDRASNGAQYSHMQAQIDAQAAQIEALKRGQAPNPALTIVDETIKVADPLDHDKNGKKGGTAPDPEEDPQWATFEDIDIANMLTEAGIAVDGRWGRKTLIEKAEELIAKKGKKS